MLYKKKYDWSFFIGLFLIGAYFLFRLIDESKMLKYFPLDIANDGSSHMAQLFFLDKCGFHNMCNYWYNGFVSFIQTPPGWHFFSLPIYKIVGSVNATAFISIIISFMLAFTIIWFLYYKIGLSKIEGIALFLFFFGNANSISSFIRNGRVHELFAWSLFIFLFFLVYYYKDRDLDSRFWIVAIVYALIIIVHQTVGILATFMILGLFLAKSFRDKIKIVTVGFISVLMNSFWTIPFIKALDGTDLLGIKEAHSVWIFDSVHLSTNIFIFIVPIILFLLSYLYIRDHSVKKMNDFLFYSPILFLALLFFLRLHAFIPILQNIIAHSYITLFSFFILFLFFKINFNPKYRKMIFLVILIIILLSIGINVYSTELFITPNGPIEMGINNVLIDVNGSVAILGDFQPRILSKAVYSYIPVRFNIPVPSGWYHASKPLSYHEQFSNSIEIPFNNQDCNKLVSGIKIFNVTSVIAHNSDCNKLINCGFKFKNSSNNVCLLSVN